MTSWHFWPVRHCTSLTCDHRTVQTNPDYYEVWDVMEGRSRRCRTEAGQGRLVCSCSMSSTRHWPEAWTAMHLCENRRATLAIFAFIIWTVFVRITIKVSWSSSDVTIGLSCEDFIPALALWPCATTLCERMWVSFDPRKRTICGLATVAGGAN